MNANEVIDDLSRALGKVAEQEQEVVSVSALQNYLSRLKEHAAKVGETKAFCRKCESLGIPIFLEF